MTKLLEEAYDPEKFQKIGHELVGIISQHLGDAQESRRKVSNWTEPNSQLKFWEEYEMESASTFFNDVLHNSISVHNPKYIGHQISAPVPASAVAGLLSSILNNGMAVYEMGAAASAIEKVVVQEMTKKVGFDDQGDGFLTSGGTLATLTAMLSARKAMVEHDIWEEGVEEDLAVIVSSEAHYCVDRALRIMGLGSKGIIKIPVDERYSMRTDLLPKYYDEAMSKGLKVIAVVGSAPSTSTGIYDDLNAIASFCKEKHLWFHADGAHGGAAIFSEKYKHLLKGIDQANSVIIDGHKMMMMPSIMTFILFKDKANSYAAFSQKAQYLLEQSEEEEWYNFANRTFECTKYMMSIQFFLVLKLYSEAIFDDFVTCLYDLAGEFARKIQSNNNFELALQPQSNIVCFRYRGSVQSDSEMNEINNRIRQAILTDGEFYIVKTTLNDQVYMRMTFMNPKTDTEIMDLLIDKIERIGIDLR